MDVIDNAPEGGDWDGVGGWEHPRAEWPTREDPLAQAPEEDRGAEASAGDEAGVHADAEAGRYEAGDYAALERGHAELTRDIPGWSPAMAQDLGRFARREFGFSEQELDTVTDPRLVKLLHRAYANAAGEARFVRVRAGQATAPAMSLSRGLGRSEVSADTEDFAAFEKMADARLRAR